MSQAARFLTAGWRDLAMLSYAIDPAVLADRVPAGCELDDFEGNVLVSVVGFRFLDTRVLGLPIPFHRDFEEVNLRFYVRRRAGGSWRRGVVFVKEIVPRRAVAAIARLAYREPYVALPMRQSLRRSSEDGAGRLAYEWWRGGRWEGLSAEFSGAPVLPAEDGIESFITEHYWGYSRGRRGRTLEYEVEHPRWSVRPATSPVLDCDVAALYGSEFVEALSSTPSSAFVAEGSAVVVRRGRALAL